MVFETFYILLFFWLAHITHRILYGIYFWQLKEYRVDRIIGDFKKSFKVLFPKTATLGFFLLLFLLFFVDSGDIFLWNNLVSIIFYLLGAYSLFLLSKKAWRVPKPTIKTIALMVLSFGALFGFAVIFKNKFFLFISVTEVIIGMFTLLIVQLMQIPTALIKNIVYSKAKKKIAGLKNLTVIGITGSYGKSSTKEFLYAILSLKYNVLKTTGNINTEIGVAKTIIKDLKPEHQIFIVEMGAYRKGEISLLCNIVNPQIGVVTGVNQQHMSLFGSWDNLLSAEGGRELAESLPKDGKLFVNGNNKYCLDLLKRVESVPEKNKKIYSLSNKLINADIWSSTITIHKNYVSFLAINKDGHLVHFNLNVLGRHNVQNFLGAALIGMELGISLEEASLACKKINQKLVGATLMTGKHETNIIDSSYSANPDGVSADLDYLSIFPNKKIIVMPCLIELGKEANKIHENIGKKIGQICDLAIVTTEDNFMALEKGFNQNKKKNSRCVLCKNADHAYSLITTFCKSGDVILFEGRVSPNLIKRLLI